VCALPPLRFFFTIPWSLIWSFFFHLNSYTFESELPRIAYLLPSYIVKLTIPHLDIEGLMQYFVFGFTEQSPALGSILLVRLFADLGL